LHIPEWYINMSSYKTGTPILSGGSIDNATVKRCAPVLDAFNFGYMAVLHCDVSIDTKELSNGEYEVVVQFASEPAPIATREYNNKYSLTMDNSYIPLEFVWLLRWQINTEPNSSVLITHPLNRLDLPFTTSSGVMDTDSGFMVNVSGAPFYIKKGFNGVITAGTPMFQVIPFERQPYKYEVRELSEVNRYRRTLKWTKHFNNGYRKEHRAKKSFK
jgi:hypothetical protein